MPTALTLLSRQQKIALMLALDGVSLPLLLYAAMCLRHGYFVQPSPTLIAVGLAVCAWCQFALFVSGLYLSVVRYLDSRIIMRGVGGMVAVLGVAAMLMPLVLPEFKFAYLAIFGAMACCYVGITRIWARSLIRRRARQGAPRALTVIYGAGRAGAYLAQAMQTSREYEPIYFVDDDPALQGKYVGGLRVYAPARLFGDDAAERIQMLVIALPTVTARRRQEILDGLEPLSIPTRVLPDIRELVNGRVSLSALREVELPDLLGREPVAPRPDLFARNIRRKNVLVTGAGGSIGSELCRQVASQRPSRLVLFEHSEFALYSIDQELRGAFPSLEVVSVLGSITNSEFLESTLRDHAIHTVYHAAAYKHVPLVEANVLQGMWNNIFGSLAVARAAAMAMTEACILISTDKAVRPTNVMGATKRVAEQIFQALSVVHPSTRFCMVRFGNVLGSSGSVVPLFRRQIREGGPITLTHQDINRFFMLIPEASQLVIQAGAMARGGEVFVLDMGDPVKIIDLARKMIHLSGMTERTAEHSEGDIEIKIVGLRPGEKLYEELLLGDDVQPSEHPKIARAHENHLHWAELQDILDRMREAIAARRIDAALLLLRRAVPEYAPAAEEGFVPARAA